MVRLPPKIAESGEEARKQLVEDCASRTKSGDILELWYNPNLDAQSENVEYLDLMELIEEVEATGEYTVHRVDAAKTSEEERKKFHEGVLKWHDENPRPSYYFAYAMRTNPGSTKDYGFGVKRPGLVVYRNSKTYDNIVDIYPHQEKAIVSDDELPPHVDSDAKLIVTVTDFLKALIEL